MTNEARPRLSIIVAALDGANALDECLAAIMRSAAAGDELIVAARALGAEGAALRARYPQAVFLDRPAGATLPALLGAGAARATGEIVAVTETSCLAAGDWAAAVRRAHETSASPVIGGAVEMKPGGNLTAWAAYFCDYAEFMPPLAAGAAAVVPGNNFSVKRAALGRAAAQVAPEWHKTLWCRALQSEGLTLAAAPEIVVQWRKADAPAAFFAHRFRQGRAFAARRFAAAGRAERALRAAGTPLLPPVFLYRIARAAWPKRRCRVKFCAALPLVALAAVCWSAGEAVGIVTASD